MRICVSSRSGTAAWRAGDDDWPGTERTCSESTVPGDEEHAELSEWAGEGFDPNHFDAEAINVVLAGMARRRRLSGGRSGRHRQARGRRPKVGALGEQPRLAVRDRDVQFLEAIYTSKGEVELRTNIEIDDALLAEAMAATGLRTKRKVVEAGLQLLARHKRQADAKKLFGRIGWEGDLHRQRLDEPDEPDRQA